MKILTKQNAVKESIDNTDAYAELASIDSMLDGLIVHYQEMHSAYPQWRLVLDNLIADTMYQKGAIKGLRDSMSERERVAVTNGEDMAKDLLNDSICYTHDMLAPTLDEEISGLILDTNNRPNSIPVFATESINDLPESKDEILGWLSDHKEASQDFVNAFQGSYFNQDGDIIADNISVEDIVSWIREHDQLSEDFDVYFGSPEEEDYIILQKESEGEEEGFLEYHYNDILPAKGAFFTSSYPVVLLEKKDGAWHIAMMSAECSEYKELLDEQIELLNSNI